MNKEQIIHTAFLLFTHHGVKSVSMDDVAKTAGVSKRTLYESFRDKEDLLAEGIKQNTTKFKQSFERIENESFNALEIILLFYEDVIKDVIWYNKRYYQDIKKYPKILDMIETNKIQFGNKCLSLMKQGIKEGVFEKDINFTLITTLVREQMKMVQPSSSFSEYSILEVYGTILFTLLRGISTEKGRTIIDRFKLKRSYQS